MRVRVGTSGFSYKEWKGGFYPEDLPQKQMLRSYAERLAAVEINNTFYRMPKEAVLAGWAEQVPEGFRFAMKASRRITHLKRLRDAQDETSYLLQTSLVLGERLGPTLFQLPPFLRKDAELLGGFLEQLPRDWRAAFEFRHESWFDDEVYTLLRNREAALVVAETDDGGITPMEATAPFGYLRLRRDAYDDEALSAWATRLSEQPWDEAFVFFKHGRAPGPEFVLDFARSVGSPPSGPQ